MIKDFETILKRAKEIGPTTVAVAVAEDVNVLKAVEYARLEGIVNSILIGNEEKIKAILKENCIDSHEYIIIDESNKIKACDRAVHLVNNGQAATIMKGFVDTSIILKSVLDKETGLPLEGLLSHVGVLKVDRYDRLFIISDSAINISPKTKEKVYIIKNAVKVAHALENGNPKVAIICPVEKVNDKILSTVHASELVKMNEEGEITGCIVGGPLALDNAVSVDAAKHKGIISPVAGQADILIVHNLEVGNVLNKSMEYFANTQKSGIVMGAKVPIILTSRASSNISKLNSIALSVLIIDKT